MRLWLVWQQVFAKFDEVVEQHAGAPLNDYTLRLIGSDVEHFIRKLLQVPAFALSVITLPSLYRAS